jgi:propane monooxygenase reductase subunit
MAPVLALLRQLASQGTDRTTRFLYGARARRDLFHTDLVQELGARLSDFRFTPVLSDAPPEDGWEGQQGFVHEAVGSCLASGELRDAEIYMCGPSPMIDAVMELVVDRYGITEDRIHYDKFTTSGDAEAATGAALPE